MKKRIFSMLLAAVTLLSNLAVWARATELKATEDQIVETETNDRYNADATAQETVMLDYGNIPVEYSNTEKIDLEPMLYNGTGCREEILYLSSGILRLAVYWDQHLYVNDYSADYELLESRIIPLDVTVWGGMCLSEESSFILYRQKNTEEDTYEYFLTKFDADFDEVATISLNEYVAGTLNLFVSSNTEMGLRDQTLTIFTDRYYNSSTFGYSRPYTIEIDVQKMESSDPSDAVTFPSTGCSYVNEGPYRTILEFDGNVPVYAMVTGDDYPGGIYVSVGNSLSHLQPDAALGENEDNEGPILTGATSMAVSSSHYLIASTFENYGINNIYLAVQEKETGTVSGRFLTNSTAFNSEIHGTPKIVDLGSDRFALLWEHIALGAVNVCSVLLDAAGTPIGNVQMWRDCSLSSMRPVCADEYILWIAAENGEMALHQLRDLDAGGYQEPDNGIVTGNPVWNGTSDSSWYQDGETEFVISTAEQLAGLAELVNAGNDFSGKRIRLENDLFMNSSPYGHVEGNQWVPIGASEDGSVVFNGTFDGQCHTIYNMVVSDEGLAGGVFGTIGAEGTVKCLTLEQGWFASSACVADTNYGEVLFCMAKSHVYALTDEPRGGICRYNYGLIYGCQNYGFIEHSNQCGGIVYKNMQGGTISQCANKGMLFTYRNTFTDTGTSGIAYDSYGWIYNCYNLGAAQNGSNRSAGIVGFSNGGIGCGQVYNCYSLSGYPLKYPIYVSIGSQGRVKNCFGNTEPGAEWYEEFCETEFLAKLDEQLGPVASAWLPDTLGVNNGLPIPVAQYNYHTGNYKVQPELWEVPSSVTVILSERDTISLANIEYYFSDATLEITSDNLDVAEIVDGEIRLLGTGSANILFHLDETEESTALDYTIVITVIDHVYDAWSVVTAATCTTAGEERRECINCDAFETREIFAMGHDYEPIVTKPTCTGQGYTTYRCSRCENNYVSDYVDSLGHDMGPWEPDGAGQERRDCSRCDYFETREIEIPEPDALSLKGSNVASTGQIKLNWNAVESAAQYKVYCSSDESLWWLTKTTAETSLTVSFADAGELYYFYVVALAEDGTRLERSKTVSRTCDLPRPTVTLSNVASSGKIKISWNAVEGAVKYKVYRSTDKENWTLLKTTTGTSLTNTSTEAGKLYYYKVKAIASNSEANSAYSTVKSRRCDLPQPVVTLSNAASTGKIKISWNAVEGAVKYKVYRSTDKENWTLLKTTTGTSLTNTSTEAGKLYYYKVKAIASNSEANSAYSSVKSRTCDLARPTLTVSLNSKDKPYLTWTKVTGAVKYEVYRSTDGENWDLLKTTTGTKLTHSSAVDGTKYYYKVRAIASTSSANSAYSTVKSVKAG